MDAFDCSFFDHRFVLIRCRKSGAFGNAVAAQETKTEIKFFVDEVAILATSGTVMSKIIQQELGKKHIQTLLPDERQQQKIMEIIYKQIKAGRSVEIEEFEQIGTQLQQRGAQKLLLGCTELSLLKRDFTLNQAYADVLEILASAVVTYNGLPVKEYHRQTQEIK